MFAVGDSYSYRVLFCCCPDPKSIVLLQMVADVAFAVEGTLWAALCAWIGATLVVSDGSSSAIAITSALAALLVAALALGPRVPPATWDRLAKQLRRSLTRSEVI